LRNQQRERFYQTSSSILGFSVVSAVNQIWRGDPFPRSSSTGNSTSLGTVLKWIPHALRRVSTSSYVGNDAIVITVNNDGVGEIVELAAKKIDNVQTIAFQLSHLPC